MGVPAKKCPLIMEMKGEIAT